MKIRVEGDKALIKYLGKVPTRCKKEVKHALEEVAEDLKGESQRRAPKKIGTLRKSAFAEVGESGKGFVATVGFKEPYALRQHEAMEYHHTDGEAKYLENPYKERLNAYKKSIEEATNRGLKNVDA